MCDRCESKGLLAGLLAQAGVAAGPILAPAMDEVTLAPPCKPPVARRRKLWELEEKHHCPVIGSCLNLDELKKLARKGGFTGNQIDPYRLHVEAVSLSCSRNAAAEAMHKLLERKFALTIRRFERAKTDADVLALWQDSLERGEVAAAMWAVLTHKAASPDTRQRVYGEVHMLSHQIGAGQAADLRRLEWLERQRTEWFEDNRRLKEALQQLTEQTAKLRPRRLALAKRKSGIRRRMKRSRCCVPTRHDCCANARKSAWNVTRWRNSGPSPRWKALPARVIAGAARIACAAVVCCVSAAVHRCCRSTGHWRSAWVYG